MENIKPATISLPITQEITLECKKTCVLTRNM